MSILLKRKFIVTITLLLLIALPVLALSANYIGNRNTWKFHYKDCRAERSMKEHNRIYLENREDAISRGMVPCKICRP